jgi:hypothetical protein
MKDFTLPVLGTTALTDAMSRKVKLWVFKKMATQSQTFKKRLYRYYLKENQAPEFTGYLEKQEEQWDTFLEYKESALAKKRSETNKLNASNKKYHHHLGTCGYRTAMPKWDKADTEMRAAGIKLATDG